MADSRIEFELAMKDLATKELQRFKQELANTTSVSSGFNKNLSDGEKLLKNFYMEQRIQDRTMREATQALSGFTVGLSGMLISNGTASKSVKDFNNTLLASVTAMQGAEFAAASLGIAGRNLGGRLGSIAQTLSANAGYIGVIGAATVATFGFAKALADYLYPAVDKSYKFKEAAAHVDTLANAFKQFQTGEAYKGELKAFIDTFQKQLDFQVKLRTDVGMSKDAIAAFIRNETQKLDFAKKELERITSAGKKAASETKKVGPDMGGDELKEAFENEKKMRRAMLSWKMDLMMEEEQARIASVEREKQRTGESMKIMQAVYQELANGIRGAFEGSDTSAKGVLKSVLNIAITTTEGLLIAAAAAGNAWGVITFGVSLVKDIALITSGVTILEGARAIVNRFHNGGTVQKIAGDFSNQPASREFPIMVRGGETVRTEGQERDLQNKQKRGGMNINININGKGLSPRDVQTAVVAGMRQTGLTVDKYFVNNRSNIALA